MRFANERPRMAALVAEVIGRWAHIEQEMGILMSRMFHTSATAAIEIYLAIRSQRTQKDVIDKAAEATLAAKQYALFAAVRILARSCEKDRHHFAHHLFGYLRRDRDAMLLVDPVQMTRSNVTAWQKSEPGQLAGSAIIVYRERDLIDIIDRMDRVGRHIRQLHKILDPNNLEADKQYEMLSREPDIEECLSRLRDTKSTP